MTNKHPEVPPPIGVRTAEAHGQASDERFFKVFHSSPAPMCITRLEDGKFIDVNYRFLDLFEYGREQLLGLTTVTSGILKPEVRASVKEAASVPNTLLDRELMAYTRGGKVRVVRVSVATIDWESERCLLTTVLDITANKRAEALTQGQNLVLEMIASDAPLALTLSKLATVVESQLEGVLCSVLLLDEDRLHIRNGAAPSLPDEFRQSIEGASIGPKAGSCGTAMFLGRQVITADIHTDPLWEDWRPQAAKHGLRACWSTPIASRQGKVLGAFAMYYREPRIPTAEEHRLIAGAVHIAGIAIDRKRTEDALLQSQKMEAVARLAGGIAHDFNNILMTINGSCTAALQAADASHPVHPHLATIQRSGEKAARLTQQLLAYSRKQAMVLKILDLNEVVKGMRELFRPMLSGNVRLAVTLAPAPHPVKADRSQLEQVLLNLVVNACDAMPAGGTLMVETANTILEAGQRGLYFEVEPGPYVMLSVADTGVGMSKEVLGRLFEPFFTTKPPGQGTGLGLSLVHGILKQSEAAFSVRSEPGKGSTFRIYFPAIRPEA